ncbi:MAG: hypothetical protein A3J38_08845, partial [Gammaproteobacteria bacterium RIFCSPHIGHO2_12_FULL_45_9]
MSRSNPASFLIKSVDFTVSGISEPLYVMYVRGEEALSEPFWFELQVQNLDQNIMTPDQVVGKAATITFNYEVAGSAKQRYVNAIVGEFSFLYTEIAGNSARWNTYRFRLIPECVYKLGYNQYCKIYLKNTADNGQTTPNTTALDAISQVFQDYGYSNVTKNITNPSQYELRDFCVQYNESALNFVSRLLEQEGIFYYFQHTQSQCTLVMQNNNTQHDTCPDTLQYVIDAAAGIANPSVHALTLHQTTVPYQHQVQDFNFQTPDEALTANTTPSSGTAGSGNQFLWYEGPAGYQISDSGSGRAKARLNHIQAITSVVRGQSYYPGLLPGYFVQLADHPMQSLQGKFLLTRVRHELNTNWRRDAGGADTVPAEYKATFESIPSTLTYSPPRTALVPRIYGTQTAILINVQPDVFGRVQVCFTSWDPINKQTDASTSCWVRPMQAISGKGWGSHVIPRLTNGSESAPTQEVVVTFINGNPDYPIITGMVYNGKNPVPYKQNTAQNIIMGIKTNASSDGTRYHEARLDDTAKNELFYMKAQNQWTMDIFGNGTWNVNKDTAGGNNNLGDFTWTIANNATTTISGTLTEDVKKTKTVTIEGDETYTNKGNRTLTVNGNTTNETDGNETATVKGNYANTTSGNYTLTVDGNLTIKAQSITLEAQQNVTVNGMQVNLKGSTALSATAAQT